MMKQCEKCIFYDEVYDDLRRKHNDVIVEGQETDCHYCNMWSDEIIPQDVMNDVETCKYKVD